jgi:hypothetical protein
MVLQVVHLAEDGAQAEIIGQIGGKPSRAPATNSDQRAARGQVGIRGPVGVRPAREIAGRRHIHCRAGDTPVGRRARTPRRRLRNGRRCAPRRRPGLHRNAVALRSLAQQSPRTTMIFFMPNPAPPALATRLTHYSLAIRGRYRNDGVNAGERGYGGRPARIIWPSGCPASATLAGKRNLRATTLRSYRQRVQDYLIPHLGRSTSRRCAGHTWRRCSPRSTPNGTDTAAWARRPSSGSGPPCAAPCTTPNVKIW